jgi:hypothetical protein
MMFSSVRPYFADPYCFDTSTNFHTRKMEKEHVQGGRHDLQVEVPYHLSNLPVTGSLPAKLVTFNGSTV